MPRNPPSAREIENRFNQRLQPIHHGHCVMEADGTLTIRLQDGDRQLTVVGITRETYADREALFELGPTLLEEWQALRP
ncbi:hypothetical protein [Pseudomonas tohonis]|uniref:hypothetical protein n=1 Tax=Pseudomonas tohonis TaxID=2725477 RepID=UPI00255BA714|nr:hypothetical protein [Pseudomonas tohonis]